MKFVLILVMFLSLSILPTFAEESGGINFMEVFSKEANKYEVLFEKGDYAGIANLWQKDGLFTLCDGTRLVGRKNIHNYFKEYFEEAGLELITVKVESIKELVPGKAIIETGVTKPESAKSPTAQYRVLHVKSNDKWEIAWAEEIALSPQYSLKDLDWLLGTWTASIESDTKAKFSIKKIANGNFLQFNNETANHKVIIGIDPKSGLIHSWSFDSSGGIGQGDWESIDGAWNISSLGLTANGIQSRANYILKPISKDKFLWQSTNRYIDNDPIPDLQEIEMNRITEGN